MDKKWKGMKQINKVLVANRGEIAVRIFKTLERMGIATVAVHTSYDAEALHVKMADEHVLLEGSRLSDTYLNHDQLIAAATRHQADAIHPGYGFLSEDPGFAKAVREAGLIFVGPSDEAIRLMGNKTEARITAQKIGIPVIEGATGDLQTLMDKAGEIGYPVMVKAAAGGGGKGMKIIDSSSGLAEALEATQREAKNYFGNGEVYIEKFLPGPRHIEVQILADHHGHIVSLYERDCSLQRRHQKIIEEAPAPGLTDKMRGQLTHAARLLSEQIGYTNAGTIEFLVQDNDFFFLEMNTRIQVEHAVTEMITGIDIVKEQINIAMDRSLPFTQEDITLSGHAIEARIYAENPSKSFVPSPGEVLLHKVPEGNGLRVDTSLGRTGDIHGMFDPMISKVICHAGNRETARKKLIRHLKDYVLLGVHTNIAYLADLLHAKTFIEGTAHTRLSMEEVFLEREEQNKEATKNLLAMAFLFAHPENHHDAGNIWHQLGCWRLLPVTNLMINDQQVQQRYFYHNPNEMSICVDDRRMIFRLLERDAHRIRMEKDGHIYTLYYQAVNGEILFLHDGVSAKVSPARHLGKETLTSLNQNPELEGETLVKAPMQGTVIKVNVKAGDEVNNGDTMLILESMKMENRITANAKAYVKQVLTRPGKAVADNGPLVLLSNEPE